MHLVGLLFYIIVPNDGLAVTTTRTTTMIRHEKRIDMQDNQSLQAFSITACYRRLEFWI